MMEIEINRAIADRARAGNALGEAELQELDTVDVLSLGMLADEVRRLRTGGTVTYTRVFEPDVDCEPATVAALAADGVEIRLVGLEASLDETSARIAQLRAVSGPGARLTGFSLAEIMERGWGTPGAVLGALRDAGLDALAEAPIDTLEPADVDQVGAAGLRLGALSVLRMPSSRVALVLRARTLLAGRPWVEAFAPLAREQSVTAPTTGYHDVRMVALARLGLPEVKTIQVDWQQYGPKLAQVALTFGASHLDRVSPIDAPELGPRRGGVEDVRRNIAAAGLTPAERSAAA